MELAAAAAVCAGCPEGQAGAGVTRILITGGQGFLGRNLAAHLIERKDCETTIVGREDSARRPQEQAA